MHTKTKGLQNFRESIYAGAVYGVTAWTVYAVVEYFFTAILPWVMNPSHTYTPVHRAFTALLFINYPVIGLISGGLFGLCLYGATKIKLFSEKIGSSTFAPLATLTVVLAFNANICYLWLFTSYTIRPLLPSLGASIVLLPALALSLASPPWQKRLRFLTNPWTVALVLVGILPWILYEPLHNATMIVRAISAFGYTAAIFLISFAFYNIATMLRAKKPAKSKTASPASSLVFLVPVYFLIFGIGLFLQQTPLQTGQKTLSSLQDSSRPNVILITMDTVRADHLSVYGYKRDTSPNLKKLVEDSSLYLNAIATSDITLPSHASMFTGLYSRSHGAHHIFYAPSDDDLASGFADWPKSPPPLDDKFDTLAEILSEKGYSTMAVVANPGYLHDYYNLDQGFNFYDYRSPVIFLGNIVGKVRPFYLRQTIHDFMAWMIPASDRDSTYRRADKINKVAFSLIDKVKKDNNSFFLFLNYMDAHTEYAPPAPYDRLFPGKDETFTMRHFRDLEHQVLRLERDITVKERQHLLSQYDGGIAYEDFHIGKFITRLKEAGLYDNSLIIVTADHGEAFGERKHIEHGTSVYQDQVNVPLIIKYPSNNRKAVIEQYVSGVDIMPTVLDTLGYEIPEDVQGVSLLKPEGLNNRTVISESFPDRIKLRLHKRFHRVERAIFSNSMKFITSTSGKSELYDLSKDPRESTSIYMANNAIADSLESKLSQWLLTVEEKNNSKAINIVRNQPDKDTLDRLKALGYVQ